MTLAAARRASGVAVLAALAAVSCNNERRATPNTSTRPSPNASILPAPLASTAEIPGAAQGGAASAVESARTTGDPEPAPEPAPADRPLAADPVGARDSGGYSMDAEFRWADMPPIPTGPDVPAILRDLATSLSLKVTVDLGVSGRMRFSFESDAFPLPVHSELRARTDYFGHVLVWPGATAYRVVPSGSLRALFAERRADVAPLLRAVLRPGGNGSLLGHRTIQTELETSLGVLSLEQATIPGGTAGELLCRLLVELVGVDPANDACRPERVPLSAQYRWASGGTIAFVATALGDRKDTPAISVAAPPDGARWAAGELPPSPTALLSQQDLAHLRARPIRAAVPSARVTEGVTFANETNLVEYLFLDGVPVMWLRPHSREHLPGVPAGKYQVAFRDFFGTAIAQPTTIDLPALVRVGVPEPDAGLRL